MNANGRYLALYQSVTSNYGAKGPKLSLYVKAKRWLPILFLGEKEAIEMYKPMALIYE